MISFCLSFLQVLYFTRTMYVYNGLQCKDWEFFGCFCRDYDGKVTPEEVASAAMYLKDTLGKEGIQELVSNLSKDRGLPFLSHKHLASFLNLINIDFVCSVVYLKKSFVLHSNKINSSQILHFTCRTIGDWTVSQTIQPKVFLYEFKGDVYAMKVLCSVGYQNYFKMTAFKS